MFFLFPTLYNAVMTSAVDIHVIVNLVDTVDHRVERELYEQFLTGCLKGASHEVHGTSRFSL